ncbi:hypothetical protein B0T20DRAFT_45652 [Sordaria brevicollis]|uniref:Uncharacterized protein n=1 Tax=Sordaria brevicollis TaxID=83679 RepID=A0AAE0U9R2_SORBR|nr:hypothetical protein B0T20DRAFT_45652 [Sordaria brevicollis]
MPQTNWNAPQSEFYSPRGAMAGPAASGAYNYQTSYTSGNQGQIYGPQVQWIGWQPGSYEIQPQTNYSQGPSRPRGEPIYVPKDLLAPGPYNKPHRPESQRPILYDFEGRSRVPQPRINPPPSEKPRSEKPASEVVPPEEPSLRKSTNVDQNLDAHQPRFNRPHSPATEEQLRDPDRQKSESEPHPSEITPSMEPLAGSPTPTRAVSSSPRLGHPEWSSARNDMPPTHEEDRHGGGSSPYVVWRETANPHEKLLLEILNGGGSGSGTQTEQNTPRAPLASMDPPSFSPLSSIPEGSVGDVWREKSGEEMAVQEDTRNGDGDAPPDEAGGRTEAAGETGAAGPTAAGGQPGANGQTLAGGQSEASKVNGRSKDSGEAQAAVKDPAGRRKSI